MPYRIATNFLIDGKDYVVPIVVEEPSIVAAASFMAKLVREARGFTTSYSGSLMTAQIHITNLTDPHGASAKFL